MGSHVDSRAISLLMELIPKNLVLISCPDAGFLGPRDLIPSAGLSLMELMMLIDWCVYFKGIAFAGYQQGFFPPPQVKMPQQVVALKDIERMIHQ